MRKPADMMQNRRCTWCGHIHDPEDGRCDAHAHVGVGRCPCPGDDRARRLLPQIVSDGPILTFGHGNP